MFLNKERAKKLALVVVSNKLIKQTFVIAKLVHSYHASYVLVLRIK
ncbi:hypothetical protein PHEL49_2171 [Polaribacter sp. Hel1_33_49]|nr:hypothetical protein PHEL49_2171 [Polaribacter sp. Hel1_33_49]